MRLIALLAFILTFVPSLPAFAQTVVNPRTVEFDPSPDHNALGAGGQPLVARYDLEFYLVGAAQPFQVQSLGKPAPGADGKVRVDFSTMLTAWPLPNGNYEARVTAVGPTGAGRSDPSNAFTFLNCSFAVSPTSASVAAGGGSGSVTLTTATGCAWTATSGASWVTVSPASGGGSGTVSYTAAANATTAGRTGTLTIGGQTVTIAQGAVPCTFGLSASSQSVGAGGGSGSVNLTTTAGCGWTATSNATWLTVTPTSGTASAAVSFTAAANTTPATRTGTLTIGGQTFTITQAAATCSFSLSALAQSVAASGAGGSVTVTTMTGCSWTATSGASWVTVSPASGSGSGSVSFTVAANTATTARSATLTIGGQTFTITQAAASCTFTLGATSQAMAAAGGSGSVAITTTSGCSWTATSAASWVTVSPASGSGSGSVSFTVAANTATTARSATLTIGSHTFTITQAAASCTFTLGATSQAMAAAGGSGSVAITTTSGCSWTATSGASWVTVSPASGSGSGTVSFTVAANSATTTRTATLTIGGQTFTVTQAAATCSFSLSALAQSVAASGASGTVTVTTMTGCSWTATSGASWVTVSPASGSGSGSVSFTVAANTATTTRTATLTIGGQTFTITQAAASCTFSLSASSQAMAAAGGSGSVAITTTSSCSWTATSGVTWVTVSPASGSGSGTVTFTVAGNASGGVRTGSLLVAGQTVTITQAAASLPAPPTNLRVVAPATTPAADPAKPAPPLPAPTGAIVRVTTEAQLQAAVQSLASNTTILIAPGTYTLTHTLAIVGPLSNVSIRGDSNSRHEVVLVGLGRDNANYGSVPHGIWVSGDVRNLTIANLTIRDVYYHPICLNPGPQSPRIYNVHLINGGQQLLKTNPNADGTGINNGVIEYSVFEYEPTSRDWYANAIQVLAGANWIIRNNLIRNIRAPQGELAGPAVLAWFGASGTIVEGNTFINCQREISFGLIERAPHDHSGGIIRNNFIYRDASLTGGDVAIGVFDSPNTRVLNNTILIGGTYPSAIEYRFAGTTGVVIANNLADKGIRAREGASAQSATNDTTATAELFVNPTVGDLHLRATATVAIDRGTTLSDVTTDWDGDARPQGTVTDIGADEYKGGPLPSAAWLPRSFGGFGRGDWAVYRLLTGTWFSLNSTATNTAD